MNAPVNGLPHEPPDEFGSQPGKKLGGGAAAAPGPARPSGSRSQLTPRPRPTQAQPGPVHTAPVKSAPANPRPARVGPGAAGPGATGVPGRPQALQRGAVAPDRVAATSAAGLSGATAVGLAGTQAAGQQRGLQVEVGDTPFSGARLVLTTAQPSPPNSSPARHRAPRVLRLRAIQVIAWQVALLAVALASRVSAQAAAMLFVTAAALLALTTVRVQSMWLYQFLTLYAGYRARAHRHLLPAAFDKAPALLSVLIGSTTLRSAEITDEPVAIVGDADGVAALLRPRSVHPDWSAPRPADLLEVIEDRPAGIVVQTVQHTGVRRTDRRVWFAVRVLRTAELARHGDVEQVLCNAVRRVSRELARRDAASDPVSQQDASATFTALAHVNAERGQVRESWRYWSAGPVLQATFRLTGLDRLTPVAADALVHQLLGSATAVATTVTLTARGPGAGDQARTATQGVLRVAATTRSGLEGAITLLSRTAASRGIRFERLDGRQRAGVAASLPLGVPLS